jgi:hypothetical protein
VGGARESRETSLNAHLETDQDASKAYGYDYAPHLILSDKAGEVLMRLDPNRSLTDRRSK